jgi:hypothetical protein
MTKGTRRFRPLAWLGGILLAVACGAVVGWMALAIYFDLAPGLTWWHSALALLVPVFALVAVALVRPRWWVVVGIAVAFVAVLMVWFAIPPSNSRDWQPDVATLPWAEVRGDQLVFHNVRNADYRTETDYTVRLEDRDLDLSKLRALDLFLIYWGSPLIAHTIMSWEFGDGQHLAISIETRKKRGQSYSAVRGFFRQYELIYVVADERDVIRLRTNYRRDPPEDVYIYRAQGPPENARLVFLDYVRSINELAQRPAFYNTLTSNCTNVIYTHASVNPGHVPFSWKILLSGYAPEYIYDRGRLDRSLPFEELRRRSLVNAAAQAADQAPDFSRRIRAALPRKPS